jgi:hypothetical protein
MVLDQFSGTGMQSPNDKLNERNRWDVSWSYLPKPGIIIHFGCQNILGTKTVYGYEYSKVHSDVKREITTSSTRFFFLGVFITFSHNKKINQLKNL